MKTRTKKTSGVVLIAAILLTMTLVMPVQAEATTIITNDKSQLNMYASIPCTGEIVHLEGILHSTYHAIVDDNGGFHVKYHANPQGVSGVGLFNEGKYRATGVTQGMTTFHENGGMTHTYVNNFRIISKGSEENYMIHVNSHMTINPDGTITSFHDNVRITCT